MSRRREGLPAKRYWRDPELSCGSLRSVGFTVNVYGGPGYWLHSLFASDDENAQHAALVALGVGEECIYLDVRYAVTADRPDL